MKIFNIEGIIGWHVTPADVREFLNEANGEPVRFDIGSPGGFVMEGLEIFNLIRDYEGDTEVRLMGLAASMASYIALAADKRTAHDNAVYMIHNVSGWERGDHRALRAEADVVEGLTKMLAKGYVRATSIDPVKIREMMDGETYLFGDEIAEKGFVHEIIDTDNFMDKSEAVALAKATFKDSLVKMKDHENAATDLQRAAAYLNISIQSKEKPINQPPQEEGEDIMNLEELFKGNPEAKAEHDALIAKAKADGAQAVQSRVDKCAALIAGDQPKAIIALAVKVLKGEEEPAALTGAVTILDAQAEAKKEADASAESDKLGDTPAAGGPTGLSEDGTISNEADYQAELNRAKGGKD